VKSLDRKLLRDTRLAAGRLLAIAGILAVGVACYIEMQSAYDNLTAARDRFYAECRMADFSIELKKLPVAELAGLRQIAEIAELQPRIGFFATVDIEHQPQLLNAQVLSLPDRRTRVLNDIRLRRGSYFTPHRDNEVIVIDSFARQHALRPGDTIHLILNHTRQELFIVGTAISSEFVYLVGPGSVVPDPEHFGVFYLKQSFAEEVFDFSGAANQVLGRLTPEARGRADDVLRRAEVRLQPYGVVATTPLRDQPSNRYLSEEINGLATFTTVLPAIFLTVAAMVLNILMTRWTEQQRTLVGTLKATGYSDVQVAGHFLKFGLLVGLAGGAAGSALGYGLAHWITGVYGQFYEFPALENRFYPGTTLLAVGASVACSVLGSLHGAHQVLRLSPAEAMRPRPPLRGGAIFLERFGWLWRRLSFGWRMVLRDVSRQRVRTLAGMFAAAMGTCILVTGLTLNLALRHLIDFQFRLVQRSDMDLAFKDERGLEALDEARRWPGVDWAEPLLDVSCTLVNGPYSHRGSVQGLLPQARLTMPRDAHGRRVPIPSTGLAMTNMLADKLHVAPGDWIEIHPTQGARRVQRTQVVHIVDGYIGLAVYADWHYLNRLVDEAAALNGVQLAVDPRPQSMQALHRHLKQLSGVQAVRSRQDTIRNLNDTILKVQSIFIGILIAFAGILFFGSVLNTSLINLAERQTEVATFRVLGYGPWEVGGLFLRESMVVNVLGLLLGCPLGFYLSRLMAAIYNTELVRIPVLLSPAVYVTTLILGALFALLAHAVVQRSIHRFDWLAALKVKE
jgi:putative ABC transport system permease protein